MGKLPHLVALALAATASGLQTALVGHHTRPAHAFAPFPRRLPAPRCAAAPKPPSGTLAAVWAWPGTKLGLASPSSASARLVALALVIAIAGLFARVRYVRSCTEEEGCEIVEDDFFGPLRDFGEAILGGAASATGAAAAVTFDATISFGTRGDGSARVRFRVPFLGFLRRVFADQRTEAQKQGEVVEEKEEGEAEEDGEEGEQKAAEPKAKAAATKPAEPKPKPRRVRTSGREVRVSQLYSNFVDSLTEQQVNVLLASGALVAITSVVSPNLMLRICALAKLVVARSILYAIRPFTGLQA